MNYHEFNEINEELEKSSRKTKAGKMKRPDRTFPPNNYPKYEVHPFICPSNMYYQSVE